MPFLFLPHGTYSISSGEWTETIEKYFHAPRMETLSLIIHPESGSYSLAVTNPLNISFSCIAGSGIVHAEVLQKALLEDATFASLRLELGQQPDLVPGPDEITLLSYFFLNPFPFSISMISRWFADIGTEPQKAEELARIAFFARVGKDETDPWFIAEMDNQEKQQSDKAEWQYPGNPGEIFTRLPGCKELHLRYDSLEMEPDFTDGSVTVINMRNIRESGFLIEDHAVVIAGLSVTITEFSKLTEQRWPLFTSRLLNEIPVSLRDYYSVGRLITEKPGIMNLLVSLNTCELGITGLRSDGSSESVSIGNRRVDTISSVAGATVPVFLKIRK